MHAALLSGWLLIRRATGIEAPGRIAGRPLLRPGEVQETVPGLVISQHSGDGKANQYCPRGFDLDHGTDFATSVRLLADVFHVLDARVSDVHYYYVSRLPGEPAAGAADVHSHPASPRTLRASLAYVFR